jgi:hypothetical protein
MNIVSVPIAIPVKRGTVDLLENSISIHQFQIDEILRHSRKKTSLEWIKTKRGIKIPLTSIQQKEVVQIKDQLIHYMSPSKNPKELLLRRRGFGFAKHAFHRILERIERLSEEEIQSLGTTDYNFAINPNTLEIIVKSLIDSNKSTSFAEWKGHPYLNFNFVCEIEDRELEITVNFQLGILIVTMIVSKETGYFIREVYSFENGNPVKKPSPYN